MLLRLSPGRHEGRRKVSRQRLHRRRRISMKGATAMAAVTHMRGAVIRVKVSCCDGFLFQSGSYEDFELI